MSSTLDLERIDNLDLTKPEDLNELGRMVDDCYRGSQPYLETLARIWERNIRFFMGDQYLYYSDSNNCWEEIPLTKYNDWIPRPVDNQILPIVQTVVSLFTRQKPSADVRKNSDKDEDRAAAKLGDTVIDAKWEQDDEQRLHIKAALILALCGTVFRKDYWDPSKGRAVPIPSENGGMEYKPIGDTAVEMIDPFRIIPDIENGTWFIEANVKPISWIKKTYSQKGEGYTGLADLVVEDEGLSTMMMLHESLKTSTSIGAASNNNNTGRTVKGSAVLKDVYINPTRKYPKGLTVIHAGGQVLYVKETSYYDENVEDSWHPFNTAVWQDVYFRYHGLSLVENLIPSQQRINSIDSLIILTRQTMAIPQWLIPNTTQIPEGYISGMPGLNIYYNGATGLAPQKVDGRGVDVQVWKERETTVEAMHRRAGDNEVLGGTRPEGVNTAAGLNMLLEQSFSKFSPQVHNWEKFIEKGQEKKLRLIAKRYRERRPEFENLLKQMNKDNLDLEIKQFLGADLRDNFSVRIEAGSSLPRSKAYELQLTQELIQMGMFGPVDPVSNPIGNQEVLEKFGMKAVHTEMNADVLKARWVNTVLTAVNRGEMPLQAVPSLTMDDNLQIHYKIITDQMKSPDFKDNYGVFQLRLDQIKAMMQGMAQVNTPQMAPEQALAPQASSISQFPRDQGASVGPSNLTSPEGALNTEGMI